MMPVFSIIERCISIASLARGRCRAFIFSLRGAKLSQKIFFGAGCRIDRPWCVRIGLRFFAENNIYMKIVSDSATVEIGDLVFVGRGAEFDVIEKLIIGDHTVVAPNCLTHRVTCCTLKSPFSVPFVVCKIRREAHCHGVNQT